MDRRTFVQVFVSGLCTVSRGLTEIGEPKRENPAFELVGSNVFVIGLLDRYGFDLTYPGYRRVLVELEVDSRRTVLANAEAVVFPTITEACEAVGLSITWPHTGATLRVPLDVPKVIFSGDSISFLRHNIRLTRDPRRNRRGSGPRGVDGSDPALQRSYTLSLCTD